MLREHSSLLTAVILCILITGTVVAYVLFTDGGAPPPELPGPPPATVGTPGTSGTTGTPMQLTSRTFSITVTPALTTARPGDTVRFTLAVHPEGGFTAPVQARVSATALSGTFRDTYDLGTIFPPYPPLTYEVTAPSLPPLVSSTTVDAVVTVTGGGTVRTEQVQLVIRR